MQMWSESLLNKEVKMCLNVMVFVSSVRDTFCSYGVMDLCTKGLGTSIVSLQTRGINLSCVRTLCVIAEERPRIQLTTSFTKLFSGLGLSARAVSTSFGCRVNVGISLQVGPGVTLSGHPCGFV